MKLLRTLCILRVSVLLPSAMPAASDPAGTVPAAGPRALVLAGQGEAFRAYCTTGPGAKPFAKLRADLERARPCGGDGASGIGGRGHRGWKQD